MRNQATDSSLSVNQRIEYVENAETPDDPCTFVFRTSKTTERPLVLVQDFADLAMIPVVFLITWFLPVRVWDWLVRSAVYVGERLVPRDRQLRVRSAYERVLGELRNEKWVELRRNLLAETFRSRYAVAREFSPRLGHAAFEITGMAELVEQLELGKGAVLWVNRFSTYPILSKRALAQEGVLASAISHKCHGYSDSRFAAILMNKIQIAAENRYLMQRLVFDDGEEMKVQKRTLLLLKKGHPVFITNTSLTGHRYVELNLGCTGKLRMSIGPMAIALRTGAPIFSVSVFQVRPFTHYRVEIKKFDAATTENARFGKQRSDYVSMAHIARASRDIILDGIRRSPDQSARIILDE